MERFPTSGQHLVVETAGRAGGVFERRGVCSTTNREKFIKEPTAGLRDFWCLVLMAWRFGGSTPPRGSPTSESCRDVPELHVESSQSSMSLGDGSFGGKFFFSSPTIYLEVLSNFS